MKLLFDENLPIKLEHKFVVKEIIFLSFLIQRFNQRHHCKYPKKLIAVLFILFCSCNNISTNISCTKINLRENDFIKISFTSLPKEVQDNIVRLATIDKKMDTVLSLEKGITYTYYNPGAMKGYAEQVLKDKEMHTINGKCYEFLLYSMPYIIYDSVIFSFDQNLGSNCLKVPCIPDTIGINETIICALPLNKILKK